MANTLTSSQVAGVVAGTLNLPPTVPGRLGGVHVKFVSAGTSVSSGDVIQMVAMPAWTRILGGVISRGTTPTDSMIYALGYTGGTAFAAAGSFSTTTGVAIDRLSINASALLSISEMAATQFDTVDLTLSSLSACVTCDIHLYLSYRYEPHLKS